MLRGAQDVTTSEGCLWRDYCTKERSDQCLVISTLFFFPKFRNLWFCVLDRAFHHSYLWSSSAIQLGPTIRGQVPNWKNKCDNLCLLLFPCNCSSCNIRSFTPSFNNHFLTLECYSSARPGWRKLSGLWQPLKTNKKCLHLTSLQTGHITMQVRALSFICSFIC